MRLVPILACILLLSSAPVAAQQLGARTTSPRDMAAELGPGAPEEEMRTLVAAAERHPLGTIENPIRVGGPEGEHAYLGRLRCANGTAPTVGARSSAGVGAFGSVVASYDVTCGGARHRLVFDMYHEEHVETRAPADFTLVS